MKRSPLVYVLFAVVLSYGMGCAGRPSLMPNRDPALRRTSTQFAADAAKRHPYKGELPRGGEAVSRATVDYAEDRIDIVNLSDEDWSEVEIWLNQSYVCFVPAMPKGELKSLNFQMFYDADGNYFPIDYRKMKVNSVEVLRNGTFYDIPLRLPD